MMVAAYCLQDGVVTNKSCWNMIKPFLTNKGHINREKQS